MTAATVVTPSSPRSMAVAAAIAFFFAVTAAAASPVPAIYVLGDSLADVGNNNHLVTLLKADFPHNGIDYPGQKATGRFSNGKNSVDFLGTCGSDRYDFRFICICIPIWISDRPASFSSRHYYYFYCLELTLHRSQQASGRLITHKV
jgi:hypothetical protein